MPFSGPWLGRRYPVCPAGAPGDDVAAFLVVSGSFWVMPYSGQCRGWRCLVCPHTLPFAERFACRAPKSNDVAVMSVIQNLLNQIDVRQHHTAEAKTIEPKLIKDFPLTPFALEQLEVTIPHVTVELAAGVAPNWDDHWERTAGKDRKDARPKTWANGKARGEIAGVARRIVKTTVSPLCNDGPNHRCASCVKCYGRFSGVTGFPV